MPENAKKVLEKVGQGEYEFTSYGEFLCYFHAHIDIFKRLLKAKNVEANKADALVKSTKAYMTANVKKTDHFFEHLPNFASMLGVPQNEIQNYLNTNFIEVLGRVKDKLKQQELEKQEQGVQYNSILEEIVEGLQVTLPADLRFADKGILIVLENTKTGEMIEPQGLMAESAKAALSVSGLAPTEKSNPPSLTEALASANAPPQVVKKVSVVNAPEKSILQEIVESFGDQLTGEKLNIQIGPPGGESQIEDTPKPKQKSSEEEYEIEDLEFEEETNQTTETIPDMELSFEDTETEGDLPIPEIQDPMLDLVKTFTVKSYLELSQMIGSFQQKNDQVGYQNWLRSQGELEKTVVAFRTQLMKEQKGEPVDWPNIFAGIISKTQFQEPSLDILLKNTRNYQWVKLTLDRAIIELKKGSPDFVNLVRLAWPHIQKAFLDVPNFDLVQRTLKGILSRVNDENHKKEFTRIFSMAINFLQSKYQV
ncbi:hypothetical protein LPTSP4_01920 [Leptospira ryugenii]|uniref:Uncharacterized protein n=1 Tax=Leptospira ryugenii TaxID=1917863 RepID=A0A2P2DVM2_9LEPT|nr:hypothetical protein [Leptospira ryugenii]GBF48692.1 hypothetical protein LPTSP4_01920 [Leptospira ryugenii]